MSLTDPPLNRSVDVNHEGVGGVPEVRKDSAIGTKHPPHTSNGVGPEPGVLSVTRGVRGVDGGSTFPTSMYKQTCLHTH